MIYLESFLEEILSVYSAFCFLILCWYLFCLSCTWVLICLLHIDQDFCCFLCVSHTCGVTSNGPNIRPKPAVTLNDSGQEKDKKESPWQMIEKFSLLHYGICFSFLQVCDCCCSCVLWAIAMINFFFVVLFCHKITIFLWHTAKSFILII